MIIRWKQGEMTLYIDCANREQKSIFVQHIKVLFDWKVSFLISFFIKVLQYIFSQCIKSVSPEGFKCTVGVLAFSFASFAMVVNEIYFTICKMQVPDSNAQWKPSLGSLSSENHCNVKVMKLLSQLTGVPIGSPASDLQFKKANLVKTTNKPKVVSWKINFPLPYLGI